MWRYFCAFPYRGDSSSGCPARRNLTRYNHDLGEERSEKNTIT
jgi:hypothetical protein